MNVTPTSALPLRHQHRLVGLMALCGVVLALGFPNDVLPGVLGDHPVSLIAWLALIPFCWGMLALSPKPARWGAWLFGLAFALIHLSWMTIFGILPWLLLALYLSVYPLLACCLAEWMPWGRMGRVVGFALALTVLEWLRGLGVFGFPWAEMGMSQVDGALSGIASLGGLPLITFLMLLVAGAIALRLRDAGTKRFLRITVVALLACYLAGWLQTVMATTRQVPSDQKHVQFITLVQPSVLRGVTAADLERQRTYDEWLREHQRRLEIMTPLSKVDEQRVKTQPRLVIWPESAVPFPPYPPFADAMQALCRETESALLVGAPGYTEPRNAAYLLGRTGNVVDQYDKIHLVPFGEFVPFIRPLIDRFYSIRATDLVPGTDHRLLRANDIPFGVGICFESTFTGIAREYAVKGAHLLVYVTNDAWFHRTAAVRQHFNQARFRAIETGLPVARCASTGISGFIAPDGRILAEIPTYRRGAVTQLVAGGQPGTVYTAFGWCFAPLCLLGLVGLIGVEVMRRRRARQA